MVFGGNFLFGHVIILKMNLLKWFFNPTWVHKNYEKITGNSYNPPWSLNKALFLWEEVGTGGMPLDLLWFPDLFCREVMTQEEHTGKAGFPGGKRDVGFFNTKLSCNLGGGFKYFFYVHPYFGEMIHFD